jgi:hypothetical protein
MPGVARHRRIVSGLLMVFVPASVTACSMIANFDGLVGDASDAAPSMASDGSEAVDGMVSVDAGAKIDGGDSGRLPDGGCPSPRGGPACDYNQIYGLNLPTTDGWAATSDVPYDVNNVSTVGKFSRVAYRLIIDSGEVWVEMDAFTSDATTLGIPFDTVYDQDVANMLVRSTDPNQPSLPTPVAGHVQIWANCYHPNSMTGNFDGADVCDPQMPHCYGTIQLNAAGKSTLSFHHFAGQGTGDVTEMGIGPSTDPKHPDWTFAANSTSMKKKRLEIFVK